MRTQTVLRPGSRARNTACAAAGQGRPGRAPLAIERQLSAPVGNRGGPPCADRGSSPHVDDLDSRREADLPSGRPQRSAEIDVFPVEKEPLVQEPYRDRIGPADE